MHLAFTEEQEQIRKLVRQFARTEVAPFVPEMEKGAFPRRILAKMGALGLMGIPVPEEYGGSGLDFISYIITIHELARVSPALAVILSVHTSVGTNPILQFGTEEQKETFVPKLARGKYLAAFCLTEPGAGSDAAALATRAERAGDHYFLNGSKVFITNGGEADVYIVFARTGPGKKGITAFIVEKDSPGLLIGKEEKKMGLNGSRTVSLHFENMKVPENRRLGAEGEGYKIAMANLNAGRIGIAAQSLGIAEGAYEHALRYAKERKQFGETLIEHQAIAFKLADMATKIEAARLLVYRAAFFQQNGTIKNKDASMAKLFASNTAMEVTTEAIQILGGYGYSQEYPVERYFRDAKVTQIYEGTNEIQRLVISKFL